jgi:hypothetical protein
VSTGGPSTVTLPPTSTVVPEPVILPPFLMQMPPRVAMFAGTSTPSIVRQVFGLSW